MQNQKSERVEESLSKRKQMNDQEGVKERGEMKLLNLRVCVFPFSQMWKQSPREVGRTQAS